eukprot:jgi/Mesvir1/27581/Mv07325-RA.1
MAIEHEHQRRVAARPDTGLSMRDLGVALASELEEERANGVLPALPSSSQARDNDRARKGRPSHEESRPQSASSAVNAEENDPANADSDRRASWILELQPQETEDSKYLRRDPAIADTPVDRMRHLWIHHTDSMERNGKAFLKQVDERHARTLASIAALQSARFDLAVVLTILQEHCQYLKDHVLDKYRDVRRQEGRFLRDLYMMARREFEQGIQKLLDAEEAKHRAHAKSLQQQHVADVERERAAQAARLESQLCREGDVLVDSLAGAFEAEQRALQDELARVRAGSEKVRSELAATQVALAGFEKERAMMNRASELLEMWKDRYQHDSARITALEKELKQVARTNHARINKVLTEQKNEAKRCAQETDRFQKDIRVLEDGLRTLLDNIFPGGWASPEADAFLQHHKLPYLAKSFAINKPPPPQLATFAPSAAPTTRSNVGSEAASGSARSSLMGGAGLTVRVPSPSSRSGSRAAFNQ